MSGHHLMSRSFVLKTVSDTSVDKNLNIECRSKNAEC
jgi:hypothetical protein